MSTRPKSRNWNDVQTAIATAAIVTTLGLWNLIATPPKTKSVQASEPTLPPTEPPVEAGSFSAPASVPTAMPQVKIMFAQATPQSSVLPQVQNINQQVQTKKKKKNKNSGGTASITQTKTS